jgi:outer membrane protein
MLSIELVILVLLAPAAGERLSLSGAIQKALQSSPRTIRAASLTERAAARTKLARAAWLPTLNGVASLTQLDNDRVIGDRVVQAGTSFNAALVLGVPLIVPQRWLESSRQGVLNDAASQAAKDVERLIALEAGRAFLSLRLEQEAFAIAERAVKTSAEQLELIRKRRAEGVASRLEEARAERELRDNEGRVALRRGAIAQAREQLQAVLGLETPVDIETSIALPAAAAQAADSAELADRPDLVALRLREKAADRAVREGWLDYLPTLNATAQAYYQNPPTVSLPQLGWQVQFVLNLALFDGGKRYGDQHDRLAQRLEVRAEQGEVQLRASADVKALRVETVSRREAAAAARASAALAEESLMLARKVYEEGVGSQIDLIEAERSARDALTNAVVAENALEAARLTLALALTGADLFR